MRYVLHSNENEITNNGILNWLFRRPLYLVLFFLWTQLDNPCSVFRFHFFLLFNQLVQNFTYLSDGLVEKRFGDALRLGLFPTSRICSREPNHLLVSSPVLVRCEPSPVFPLVLLCDSQLSPRLLLVWTSAIYIKNVNFKACSTYYHKDHSQNERFQLGGRKLIN